MSTLRTPLRAPVAALPALLVVALQGCDLVDTTPAVPRGGPPPPGFATEMVDAHDAIRADPSSVGGSPPPSPALAPLSWSEAVAATAQAWADGCAYRHNPNLGSLGYGENIAAATAGYRTDPEIVGLWASEAPFYDHATNTCDTTNAANVARTCGHYTQIVWRSTTVVGCGFRTCTTNSPFGSGSWDFWVCDYAPPGNYVGQRPY